VRVPYPATKLPQMKDGKISPQRPQRTQRGYVWHFKAVWRKEKIAGRMRGYGYFVVEPFGGFYRSGGVR
jgi:hypothetical protein